MSSAEQTEVEEASRVESRGAPLSPLGSLAVPNFRNYWFSAISFVLGWQILRIVISWEGYELTNSEIFLGYLGFAMGIGTISVNLIGGVAADRVNRLGLLIATQVCMMITVSILMMLTFGEVLAPWHLLAASVAIGIIQGIDQPTRTAVIPALVPDRRLLMNALALGSSVWQGTRVFGPGLGGVLIELIRSAATFGVVTIGFGVGTILLLFVRIPRVERVPGNVFKELFEGITFVVRRNLFASLILLTFVDSFFGVAYIQLMPVFARRHPRDRRERDGAVAGGIGGGGAHRHSFGGVLGEGSMDADPASGRGGAFRRDGDDLCVQHNSVAIDGGVIPIRRL